ncbi:hypothetical protein [Thermoanaerobacter siderophilus]|uniref:Uncharacterized protein n=1 Tax=Thermoanaerobacter siderophilus SR4 TaxID=880478 RepID=I8QZM8_9THEO|nr:hypothetical protein [Thermoanaerobacter siderophilus]EIW00618.1 hypothetical protein ThesiDRAFT1_1726 [Thermoanaerobacter siderophilus SR4]
MHDLIDEKVRRYENLLNEMWTASEKYLGKASVQLLVERVVWDLSAEYKEIELLHLDENGISCKEILTSLKENQDFPVDEMFMKFITRYVEILSRLIGSENAEKIMKILREEMKDNGDNS